MTTTNNSATRPVRYDGGNEPGEVVEKPNGEFVLFADFESLRQELDLQLSRDAQLCGAVALLTARAEAAEAKAMAFRDALWMHVQAREIGNGATCTQAEINADLTVKRVEIVAALNEDNSAGRGEGV